MLLSDPLASPLAAPLATTLVEVFAASLLTLLLAAHGRWRRLSGSVLFVGWRTWLVIAPLFSLVVLAGPLTIALFAAALAVQAGREYARLASLPTVDCRVLLAAGGLLPMLALVGDARGLALGALTGALAATLPALLAQDADNGGRRAARLAFGLLYLPASLALLVLLHEHERGGAGLLLGLGLAVALSDVGAFTVGRVFGAPDARVRTFLAGRALAPRLSPSKTWAGVLGNLVGALLGILLLTPLLPTGTSVPLLALVVAVGAVWGDLLESLLKRGAAAKDSGAWLPGFGGLLDRIDSLLVVLPLTYLLIEVLS